MRWLLLLAQSERAERERFGATLLPKNSKNAKRYCINAKRTVGD